MLAILLDSVTRKELARQVACLKEHGIDPGPQRGQGSWDGFLKIHADTLWQCDFLSKPTWTARGLVDAYLLVFLHLGSLRVWISPSTVQPDSAWGSLQARNFLMVAEDMGLAPEYLMRDNEPNLRAHVERFIQTLMVECLHRSVIVSERHLNSICRVWSRHYNEERPRV